MVVFALMVNSGCVHLITHLSVFPLQKTLQCQSQLKHCNTVICSTLSSNIVEMTFQAWWLNNWCLQLCFPFSKHINLGVRKHINLIFRKHIILNFITNKLEVDTLWTTHILALVYSDIKICHSFLRCPESLITVSPLPCPVLCNNLNCRSYSWATWQTLTTTDN